MWVVLLLALTAALTVLGLRRYSPDWYSWLMGSTPDESA